MSRMMQAAAVEAFGTPPSVREWPMPPVGSGQDVADCGAAA